jgi:hypothetical protein
MWFGSHSASFPNEKSILTVATTICFHGNRDDGDDDYKFTAEFRTQNYETTPFITWLL